MKKYIINSIIKPEIKISDDELELYFKATPYNNEENNIIDGYGWHVYLKNHDYKYYLKNISDDGIAKSTELRKSLKKQIIKLLKIGEFETNEDE